MADWVIVVDDDTSNLKMAGHILSRNNMRVSAMKSGQALLDYLKDKEAPDLILLDINMPQMNGLEVLDIVRKTDPSQKIILLTIHNEVEYLMRALEIGISGYLLKDSESEVLKNAIHSVYNGENYIDATMTPLLKEQNYLKKVQSEARSNDNLLSSRETEVLCALAEGLYNKEIASKLKISEKTVKNHVSNIFKKIGVSDRTQAAVYAIRHKFVEIK